MKKKKTIWKILKNWPVWRLWGISFFFTLGCSLFNFLFFRVQQIIPIEFAPSVNVMHDLVNCIRPVTEDSYSVLLMNTVVDYGFLIGYTFLAIFSFRILLGVFGARLVPAVIVLAALPGLLDAAENVFLLLTGIRRQEVFSSVYYYVVRVKWMFALIPILLILIVAVYGLTIWTRSRKNDIPGGVA